MKIIGYNSVEYAQAVGTVTPMQVEYNPETDNIARGYTSINVNGNTYSIKYMEGISSKAGVTNFLADITDIEYNIPIQSKIANYNLQLSNDLYLQFYLSRPDANVTRESPLMILWQIATINDDTTLYFNKGVKDSYTNNTGYGQNPSTPNVDPFGIELHGIKFISYKIEGAGGDDDGTYIGFISSGYKPSDVDNRTYYGSCALIRVEDIKAFSPDFEEDVIGDTDYGKYSTPSGYNGGSFDDSCDNILEPSLPSIGVSNCGLVNVYNPSVNGLQNMGSELFPDQTASDLPDIEGDGTLKDVAQYIGAVASNLFSFVQSTLNSRLIDYVLDTHIIPIAPDVANATSIKVGYKALDTRAPIVPNDYVRVDCGTLSIAEYYQNFIDYVGTTAKLFLPFVGYVPIQPEFFQGGSLSVVYHFNVIDGSFMCFVKSTSSKSNLKNGVIAQYSGSCCVHIPITGLSFSNMVSGQVGSAIALGTSIATGNVAGAVSSGINMLSCKPDLQGSNGYSASTSFLGIRVPFLLISRQVSSFPKNYNYEVGLPLNVTMKLKNCSGFTTAESPILDDIACTDAEKDMIRNLLHDGIIL